MVKIKNSVSFWIGLISLSFFLFGCNTYSVYWNDLRNSSNTDKISITFENEDSGHSKEIFLKCNKTRKITISPGYYETGWSNPTYFNFQYLIDREAKKIEIYLLDTCTESNIGDKVSLDSKPSVFGYELLYRDFENESLVTVASRDSVIEIPDVDLWFEPKELKIKDFLSMMNDKDVCYFYKMDKEHLKCYPPASIYYLVKGNVLNEFYWIYSDFSGPVDYFINRSVLPDWLKEEANF